MYIQDTTYKKRGEIGRLDDALTRCARINGSTIVGEVLLKQLYQLERHFRPDAYHSNHWIANEREESAVHVIAKKRRRELAQLCVQYFGKAGWDGGDDDRGKSAQDYGIARLVPDDVLALPAAKKAEKRRKERHEKWLNSINGIFSSV